jgi:hypothetical protein
MCFVTTIEAPQDGRRAKHAAKPVKRKPFRCSVVCCSNRNLTPPRAARVAAFDFNALLEGGGRRWLPEREDHDIMRFNGAFFGAAFAAALGLHVTAYAGAEDPELAST